MNQDNRHILWEKGDHPSMELLQQYQEETLPPALVHQVEQHLLDCTMCSDLVEAQALSETSRIDAAEHELNQRIVATFRGKKRKVLPVYFDWRAVAGLVLVLCSAVLVFYYNYQEIKQQDQTIASETEQAIQEAMDLSEKPAITKPNELADAVPDTVKPTIAYAPLPFKRSEQLVSPEPPVVLQESLSEQENLQEVVVEAAAEAEEIAVILPGKPTQTQNPLIAKQKAGFAPETTAVAKALQGQAAGLALRSTNSVSMKRVQGQVLSPEGQPLPGVNVLIKGTNTGVATDAQGNFTLSVPADKTTLVFQYIGYETTEKPLYASSEDLKVNLYPDNKALSEVVVTRYPTPKDEAPVLVSAKPVIGNRAYKKYLQDNIRYTQDSERGRVVIRATVSPTGALQNLRVSKSLCPSCDTEAIRLVEQGPAWQPATRNGSNIEQEVKIVVRFRP